MTHAQQEMDQDAANGCVTALVATLVAVGATAPQAGAVAPPAPLVALTSTNALIRFVASTPSSVATPIAITGLDAGEAVVGIDIRPATGELFAVGVSGTTGRVLRIELTTGAATAVGTPFSTTLPAGASYAVEFTPTVDRIRFTQAGVGGVNLRLNPNNGALAGTDTPISGGSVIGAAYDRSVATATSTTLYAINDDNDSLATIGGVQQQSVAECRCGDHGRAAQRHHRPRVDPRLRHRTLRCTARRRLCGDPGGRYGEPERGAQWADDRQARDPPLERHRFVHALQPERDAPRRRRLRVFRRLVGSWRTGGLFVPTSPTRLLDTRETPSSKLARNSDVLLTIAGASPVPAAGVSSAVVNLTAVDVTAPGFVTIYPDGTPAAARVEPLRRHTGQIIPSLAYRTLGADGRVGIYSNTGTHVVVDLAGYYTS